VAEVNVVHGRDVTGTLAWSIDVYLRQAVPSPTEPEPV
jgi:hypothetical protein